VRKRTWRTPTVVSSCLVTTTSTPTGGRCCTQPHHGLARQHRAAASQISLCRVLSLFDCCTRPRPSPVLPNALRVAEKACYVSKRVLLCQPHCPSPCYLLPYAAFQQAVPISPSAYSRCSHAGYERKDSGEREYKQATLPLRKTVWGNPQKLGGIKNTAARVSSESRGAHGKVGIITRVCRHVHVSHAACRTA